MIIAGVHLDRAWPELGVAFGGVLREWSRRALVAAVDEARRHGVSTLMIVGDLMDRATVLPDTAEFAARVLETFTGNVLLAPGVRDWSGGDDVYALTAWAPNTHVWTTASFEPTPALPSVWGSAWTGSSGRAPRLERGQDVGVVPPIFVRAGLSDDECSVLVRAGRVITSGTAVSSGDVVVAPDLVHAPGSDGGSVLIVDLANPDATVERLDVPGQPGSFVEIDVTAIEDPASFAAALELDGDGRPVLVRLHGVLGPEVLLPGFGGPELPIDVALDLGSLGFGVETPDPSDRSARAEFLRAMALTRGDERQRHQTTALGMRALSESAAGA